MPWNSAEVGRSTASQSSGLTVRWRFLETRATGRKNKGGYCDRQATEMVTQVSHCLMKTIAFRGSWRKTARRRSKSPSPRFGERGQG